MEIRSVVPERKIGFGLEMNFVLGEQNGNELSIRDCSFRMESSLACSIRPLNDFYDASIS